MLLLWWLFGFKPSGQVQGTSIVPTPTPISTPIPTPTPVAEVQITFTPELISCLGADGKYSQVTKEVCDAVNKFWKEHPPATAPLPGTPGPSNSSSNSTVIDLVINTVTKYACSQGSSCGGTIGVKVTGTGYNANTRTKLSLNGTEYTGTLTGGDSSTEMLTDFTSLPDCTTFDVIAFDTRTTIKLGALTTDCAN